ncbi:MAG TPA: DUF2071 domain-containing protein [Solirubrobacteraceae bacterium]|nr:DUF2071 domain-containing protein [Solirubrobacteraceae bacterium]
MASVRTLVAGAEAALGLALPAARRQAGSLTHLDHRTWPLPQRPWLMAQTWRRLLFAHWRVPVSAVRAVVPAQLPLDLVDGDALIGVTPFDVCALRLRGTPPPPFVGSFPELNVRTYVTVDDRPGIYFFSLDADSPLAVAAARRGYRLPYFNAQMTCAANDQGVAFASRRTSSDGPPASFSARYGPTGEPTFAEHGTIDHFVTERYCLYTLDEAGHILRATIHHPPWPLQPAEARIEHNTMTAGLGLCLEGQPLLHYAERQDVVFWTLEHAGTSG